MSNQTSTENKRVSRKYGREHPRIVANLANRPTNITSTMRYIFSSFSSNRKNGKKTTKKGGGN